MQKPAEWQAHWGPWVRAMSHHPVSAKMRSGIPGSLLSEGAQSNDASEGVVFSDIEVTEEVSVDEMLRVHSRLCADVT